MNRETTAAEARLQEQIKQLKLRLHDVRRVGRERRQRDLLALIQQSGIEEEVYALAKGRLAQQGGSHESQ